MTATPLDSMRAVLAAMVVAAHANDWDRLIKLEHELARLRDQAQKIDENLKSLTPTEQARRVELLTTLLQDADEVRKHVEPWRASVGKLLSALSNRVEATPSPHSKETSD